MEEFKIDKDLFYVDATPFFEAGILKEIYSSDILSICNVSNCAYVVFNYAKSNKEGQYGLIINPNYVREIAENNNKFYDLVQKYADKTSMVLNKNTFKKLKELKDEHDIKGPTSDIDLEMEEELMGKYKQR